MRLIEIFVNILCCDGNIGDKDFRVRGLAGEVGLDDFNRCCALAGCILQNGLCHRPVLYGLQGFIGTDIDNSMDYHSIFC